MRLRSTFLLVAVFGALLFYVVRFELSRPSEKEVKAEALELVMLRGDIVDQITIDAGGESVDLRKAEGGHWYIVDPVRDRADGAAIRSLLGELSPLRAIRKAAGDPSQQVSYRLDRPAAVATFREPDGAFFASHTLLVGRKNAAFDAYYVIVDRDTSRIGLVDADLVERTLLRPPMSFRYDRLADFEVRDPEEIRVFLAGQTVRLDRDERNRWIITEPIRSAAKQSSVNELVLRFQTQRIEAFVEEEPDDLRRYGLDPARGRVEIVLEDGRTTAVLLGDDVPDGEGLFYARRASGRNVFALPAAARLELQKSLFDLRDRRLLDAAAATVVALEIERDGRVLSARSLEGAARGWTGGIDGEKRPLEPVIIGQLIKNLTALEGRTFFDGPDAADRFGFDSPSAVATLELRDGSEARVAFRRSGGRLYARGRSDGPVAQVDDDDASLLFGMIETPPYVRDGS